MAYGEVRLKEDLRKLLNEWETHDRTVKDSHVGYWRRCCKGRRAEINKLLEYHNNGIRR